MSKWKHDKRKRVGHPLEKGRNSKHHDVFALRLFFPFIWFFFKKMYSIASLSHSFLMRYEWHVRKKIGDDPMQHSMLVREVEKNQLLGGHTDKKNQWLQNDPTLGKRFSLPLLPATSIVSDPWGTFWADTAPFRGPQRTGGVLNYT